jgi:small subunit ribosomal protein S6
MNRTYESILIFNSSLDKQTLKSEINKVEDIFNKLSVANLAVDEWGKKELAYEMNKNTYGHYIKFTYESGAKDTISGLNNELRIVESLVKFQTHRLDIPRRKFKGNPNASIKEVEGHSEEEIE